MIYAIRMRADCALTSSTRYLAIGRDRSGLVLETLSAMSVLWHVPSSHAQAVASGRRCHATHLGSQERIHHNARTASSRGLRAHTTKLRP
jgi:hypothetical protein